MSCFPKAAQALKCKAERLSCCLDAGASDCDLSVCWTACKSSKFECLVSCEGKTGSDGKACRNACADTSRQCRGSCHVQRAAKQVCWATWSSCAASAVPLSMAASSSLPEHGEGHQDAEELDALEAEEDEREDEEWLSIEREVFNGYEEESVADDTEDLEAQRLHESDSLQADADADQDRREHAARQSLDVAKLELKAVPSNLQVKTVVGCPSGNGMQTVGDEWIKAVPEQCDKAASDANITASVRCCHDTALPVPARKYGSCTDLGTKTFAEAQAICRAAGMHVCSLEELWADQACKTGCGFDRVRVWTSTECSQTGVRRQSVQSV